MGDLYAPAVAHQAREEQKYTSADRLMLLVTRFALTAIPLVPVSGI